MKNPLFTRQYIMGCFIGDFIGSSFEFNNVFTKDFELINKDSHFTDDSYMTCATMEALIYIYELYGTFELDKIDSTYSSIESHYKQTLIRAFKKWYVNHPDGDYGLLFQCWLSKEAQPEFAKITGDSYGNGALMRVAPCAYVSHNLDVCLTFAKWTTEVSHNHPISLTAVECYIKMLFYVMHEERNKAKIMIFDRLLSIYKEYYPDYEPKSISYIRETNEFDPTCESTMPLILPCILDNIEDENVSLIDVIRTTVSIGGDSDTLCNIVCCLAANIYFIPMRLIRDVDARMSWDMKAVITDFKRCLL